MLVLVWGLGEGEADQTWLRLTHRLVTLQFCIYDFYISRVIGMKEMWLFRYDWY